MLAKAISFSITAILAAGLLGHIAIPAIIYTIYAWLIGAVLILGALAIIVLVSILMSPPGTHDTSSLHDPSKQMTILSLAQSAVNMWIVHASGFVTLSYFYIAIVSTLLILVYLAKQHTFR